VIFRRLRPRGSLSAWRLVAVCFRRARVSFLRRLSLAHNSRMHENSRRDVVTKHSVFVGFTAAFGYFLPAFVAEKFDVVFVFVADDVIISDFAVD